jgi:alpha-N-arabinofuranosidase
MPPTFNNRPNGLRPDLMKRMADMHPNFVRLPGGNYLEGDRPEDWYNWKETIGSLVDRPGHQAPWTYWSTDGLGLLEFLEWTEDLKVEPVLAVYAGYALHGKYYEPGKELEPYVQAALDEVEYVTGDTSTKWGAQRAKDGHPAPFPLHYIEIGNEDFFDKSGSYDARFAQFALALRKKYPQYKLIATTTVKEKPRAEPDLIDDHYYKPPYEMMDFVKHYDDAPRTGPKVFVGEWATRSGSPTPNFGDALGDAAWMTSMERNSDLILIASYAPLLVNVSPGAMQWPTDLIGFNAETTYVSPSYYAQALFAGHLGDGTVKSSLGGTGDRFFYSATVSSKDHVLHLKLVNATDKNQPLSVELTGLKGSRMAHMTSLHGATYQATNSIERPDAIHPTSRPVAVTGGLWKHTVPALTIEVIDVPLK